MVWNRMFCAAQPMLLKANVALTPSSPEMTLDRLRASMKERLSALTTMSPSVVSKVLRAACALALVWTMLEATTPLMASTLPLPIRPSPPSATASLSLTARKIDFSSADTVRAPARALASLSWASAPERTSLRTTSIPTAIASELLMLTSGIAPPSALRSQ